MCHYPFASNGCLAHLKEMTKLQMIRLDGTKVTDAGIVELQKALPNCEITR